MASVETKTDVVVNDEENEDVDIGEEVTDDGKTVLAKKSKKKKKPKKPSKLQKCALCKHEFAYFYRWLRHFLIEFLVKFDSFVVGHDY